MSVNGPGQNASASALAQAGTVLTQRGRALVEDRCTITGCSPGRLLASYSRCNAAGLRASAPSPYTVSVGNATSAPSRSALAATAMASVGGALIKARPRHA